MASVSLKNVSKSFGNTQIIENLNLEIKDKEFLVLVGPSGCGKSTLLRMVAGLEDITSGDISIGDRVVNHTPPKDRNIAMVFQNYALYPHMNVFENISFGLRAAKMPKREIEHRVKQVAEILELEKLANDAPRMDAVNTDGLTTDLPDSPMGQAGAEQVSSTDEPIELEEIVLPGMQEIETQDTAALNTDELNTDAQTATVEIGFDETLDLVMDADASDYVTTHVPNAVQDLAPSTKPDNHEDTVTGIFSSSLFAEGSDDLPTDAPVDSDSILKTAPRILSEVGRISFPLGTINLRPPYCPLTILIPCP